MKKLLIPQFLHILHGGDYNPDQWQDYPEICRMDENGIRTLVGGRHNHCNNSSVYREKVRIINEKSAERYKNNSAVIAWHISNEYGNSTDFWLIL